MSRVKTGDEFGYIFVNSCLGVPIILAPIWPYLVPKYAVYNTSQIWANKF